MLFRVPRLSFVYCSELFPGRRARYARGAGARARLMRFDHRARTVLIQLPSKTKKIFNYFSFALRGRAALRTKKKFIRFKAGY